MGKKKIKMKIWPPGQATILGLALSAIIAIIVESWLVFLIGFILLAIIGETWQYRRSKSYRESGDIKPSHPYAIVGLVFSIISMVFLILSIWGVMRIEYLFPTDGWTWSAFNGVVWNTLSLSVIAMSLSGIAILRAFKDKKYNRWLPVYSLVIAIVVVWLSMSAVVNVVTSINGMAIEGYREAKMGLVLSKPKVIEASQSKPVEQPMDSDTLSKDRSSYQ